MEPKSPSKSKSQMIRSSYRSRTFKVGVALLALLILAVFGGHLVFKGIIRHVGPKRESYFTVVLDCGSTGTRANVYEWMVNSDRREGELPVLVHSFLGNLTTSNGCKYHCMQTEPGLDKFVGNVTGVRTSIEPLINWAEQKVPVEKHQVTPIFVLATAGMRKLSVEDARQVLDDVENVVNSHDFLHQKGWIRVLSGKEEAYYGWVALNYKMGLLGNLSRPPTLGLLDLGGSSLQVVAEIDEKAEDEDAFRSRIGLVDHRIVAYSLAAFGLNEAFDRSIVILTHTNALRENAAGTFEVMHPCLSSELILNYTCRSCFGADPTDSLSFTNQINGSGGKFITVLGDPNWEQCRVLARAAAINSRYQDWSQPQSQSVCTGLNINGGKKVLNLTVRSASDWRYHALSGFYAIHTALNTSSIANKTELSDIGQKLCSGRANKMSLHGQYCFHIPYVMSLIADTLCLSNIEVIFGPGDVSWTLGAALVEGKSLWHSGTKSRNFISFLKSNQLVTSPIILFFVLSCLLFMVYCSQIKLPMLGRRTMTALSSLPSYFYPKRQPQ